LSLTVLPGELSLPRPTVLTAGSRELTLLVLTETQQQPQQHSLTAVFQVSRYQNVSIPDPTGATDDGSDGDNWSYKTCKAPVKSSSPTNQHPTFYRPDALPVTVPSILVLTIKGS